MEDFKSPALRKTANVRRSEPGPFKPSGILHFTISVSDLEKAIKLRLSQITNLDIV